MLKEMELRKRMKMEDKPWFMVVNEKLEELEKRLDGLEHKLKSEEIRVDKIVKVLVGDDEERLDLYIDAMQGKNIDKHFKAMEETDAKR